MLEYDAASPGGGVAIGLGSGEGAELGAAAVTFTPLELWITIIPWPTVAPSKTITPTVVGTFVPPFAGYASWIAGTANPLQLAEFVVVEAHPASVSAIARAASPATNRLITTLRGISAHQYLPVILSCGISKTQCQ